MLSFLTTRRFTIKQLDYSLSIDSGCAPVNFYATEVCYARKTRGDKAAMQQETFKLLFVPHENHKDWKRV